MKLGASFYKGRMIYNSKAAIIGSMIIILLVSIDAYLVLILIGTPKSVFDYSYDYDSFLNGMKDGWSTKWLGLNPKLH